MFEKELGVSESQTTTPTEVVASAPEASSSTPEATPKIKSVDDIRKAANDLPDDDKPTPKPKSEKVDAEPKEKDPAAKVVDEKADKTVEKTPAADAYSPNLKYKIKNQEKEFDKRLAQIIKTKEDEEFVRQLVTKAEGIEEIRTSRDEVAQRYQTLQGDVEKVFGLVDQGQYGQVLKLLGANTQDVGQVMQGLGFTKGDIIKYAYQLANLTPEQEAAYAKQREYEVNTRQMLQTVQQTQQQMMEMQVQSRTQELQNTMARPEYNAIVKAFDSARGEGAFWDEVVKRGQTYFAVHKKDVPVQSLVDEVASLIKGFMPQQQQMPNQVAPQAAQQFQQTINSPQASIPVIPNVGGGAQVSPAKKKIKSVSELRSFGNSLED